MVPTDRRYRCVKISADMRAWLLAILFLLAPFAANAADVDLGVSANDISFSKPLVAGDRIRLYATVHNYGDEDVEGYVSFFQGSLAIGDSQVISVRSGGSPEDVYVDFVVPSGSFNIRAEIRGTDPEDENSGNDVAITKLFTPIVDDDRDGVENAADNCPSADNENQLDTDADGQGDACDDDDDNDGLTDGVEKELGSSPTSRDTDGDGVLDPNDAYPTDASRSVVPPPPKPTPAPTPAPKPTPVVAAAEDDTVAPVQAEPTATAEPVAEPIAVLAPVSDPVDDMNVSPHAVFRYTRVSWNTFTFTALVPEVEGAQVAWDFGDGVTSNRREVTHTFHASGDYQVTFRVVNPDGSSAEDQTTVSVPFFTLENRVVLLLVGGLSVLLVLALILMLRLSRKQRNGPEEDTAVESEDVTLDQP